MKKILMSLLTLTFLSANAQHDHVHTPMNSEIDSVSYAIGMNIASSLKKGGIDTLNYEIFMQAITDVLVQNHVIMDANVGNKVVNDYVNEKKASASKSVIDEGQAYLATNGSKPDVNVTATGLQYKVIKQGTGATPVDGNKVKAHYRGTLINGKEFDSSYGRNKPLEIGVNQVIPGWTEALKMMPVGSKWELTIPYQLAYGAKGAGANIPPYATLIFEIELLEILE